MASTFAACANAVCRATAVTDAVSGHFVSPTSTDLLVACANVLSLYTYDGATNALTLVSEIALPSRPITMAMLPLSASANTVDAVAAMFTETTLSVTQWDSTRYEWKALGAHVLSPATAATTAATCERSTGMKPLLRVDAAHKVISVVTHRRFLHLIPFPIPEAGAKLASSTPAAAVATTKTADADDDGWADEADGDDTPAAANTSLQAGADANSFVPCVAACIDLLGVGNGARNVRDVVFLQGTAESTIAVLRETEPTWAGRVKLLAASGTRVRALTCGVAIVSLGYSTTGVVDTPPRTSPMVLATIEGLPYDALNLHAVPAPVGGILCLSSGSVAYLSVRGASFGSYFHAQAAELLSADKSDVQWGHLEWVGAAPTPAVHFSEGASLVPLDAVDGGSGASRWLVAAHDTGVVYQLTLVHDGRTAQRLLAVRIAPLVQAHVAALVTPTAAFLGSDVSDSVVLSLAPAATSTVGAAVKLRVSVALQNIGPVVDFDVADCTTVDLSNAVQPTPDGLGDGDVNPFSDILCQGVLDEKTPLAPVKDLLAIASVVACGGRGERHGGLTVLTRSARVQALLRRVMNCVGVFAMDAATAPCAGDEGSAKKRARDGALTAPAASQSAERQTKALLMSTASSTIVIDLRDDTPKQATDSAFKGDERTICAAQIRTTRDDEQLDIALQFTVSADQKTGQLVPVRLETLGAAGPAIPMPDGPAIVAIPLFESRVILIADRAGKLRVVQVSQRQADAVTLSPPIAVAGVMDVTAATVFPSPFGAATSEQVLLFTRAGDAFLLDLQCDDPCSGNSVTATVAATFKGLANLPTVAVADASQDEAADTRVAFQVKKPTKPAPPPTVVSARAAVLTGSKDHHRDAWTSLVVLLSTGELAVYRCEPSSSLQRQRFTKVACDSHDVPPPATAGMSIAEKRLRQQLLTADGAECVMSAAAVVYQPQFGNASLDGFLVPGLIPKIIVSDRGFPRIHPVRLPEDTSAAAFAPLNIPQCHFGFVSASKTHVLFVQLMEESNGGGNLRAPWPRARISTGGTPHRVCYTPTHRAVCVATSQSMPYRPTKAPFDTELEINSESGMTKVVSQNLLKPIAPSENIPVPAGERFSIKLFSSYQWQHSDTIELDENETVTTMIAIDALLQDTPTSVPKRCDVVVVGTAFNIGEDVACRGRLHVMGVGSNDGRKKLTTLVSENTKGPVTALAAINGLIVAAVGATVRVMEINWPTKKLRVVSFVHAPSFVTSLSVFKNYVVVGDLQRSFMVARYNEAEKSLLPVSHDPTTKDALDVGAIFSSSGGLAVVTFDGKDNAQLFALKPRTGPSGDPVPTPAEAVGNFKLSGTVRRSMRLRTLTGAAGSTKPSSVQLYITLDGEIGYIAPVTEAAHRAYRWVAGRLTTEVPSPFALHWASSRLATMNETLACPGTTLVDVDLLRSFLALSLEDRRCIATRAGMTADRVVAVLAEISASAASF